MKKIYESFKKQNSKATCSLQWLWVLCEVNVASDLIESRFSEVLFTIKIVSCPKQVLWRKKNKGKTSALWSQTR